MPLFFCFQSSCLYCIYYLEVMFSLGCIVLCLLWGGCSTGVGQSPSATRRKRESRVVNVVPGPRPGFRSFDVEHWRLHWYYAVGADHAINLHVWFLWCQLYQSQCNGSGRKDWWDWIQSCHRWTHLQSTVFVR